MSGTEGVVKVPMAETRTSASQMPPPASVSRQRCAPASHAAAVMRVFVRRCGRMPKRSAQSSK